MSQLRPLLATLALALGPAAFAQPVPLPTLPGSLPLSPSLTAPIALPPVSLPQLPALPVIPVGPQLQGQIPVQYKGTGLVIFYDTQSPYPVQYTLTGIVGAP